MPNLRVASIHSNIIPEKNIWYDVTGFTQKWHSIPVATNCTESPKAVSWLLEIQFQTFVFDSLWTLLKVQRCKVLITSAAVHLAAVSRFFYMSTDMAVHQRTSSVAPCPRKPNVLPDRPTYSTRNRYRERKWARLQRPLANLASCKRSARRDCHIHTVNTLTGYHAYSR